MVDLANSDIYIYTNQEHINLKFPSCLDARLRNKFHSISVSKALILKQSVAVQEVHADHVG